MRDAAVARDERDRAREGASVDVTLNQLVDPVQALRREADLFGSSRRCGRRDRPGEHGAEQQDKSHVSGGG